MNRAERILIVVAMLAFGVFLLLPTVRWNLFIPEDDKKIALSSFSSIADYCKKQSVQASEDLQEQQKIEKSLRTKYKKLKQLSNHSIKLGLDLRGGLSVLLEADVPSTKQRRGELSSDQIKEGIKDDIEILRRRVDGFGVSEVDIHTQADNQVVIEIPGTTDTEEVNNLLRGSGSLKFAIIDTDKTNSLYSSLYDGEGKRIENSFVALDDTITNPVYEEGYTIHPQYDEDDLGMEVFRQFWVVNDKYVMDGTYIQSVEVGRDQNTTKPLVNFHMSNEGGDKFYEITSPNVNKPLAVVLDGKIKSVATIRQALRSDVSVSGFNADEANELAILLKSSSLPVDLKIVSFNSVGASLGDDTISQLLKAIIIGFAILALFMILRYHLCGLLAVLMLIFNLFITVSTLANFSLTLTLTSIAGIILTIGMAADSSIIIFERIREDLKHGILPKTALTTGYKRARLTIIDANITTLIAAIVLSMIGSTAVKGFANTLIIGIISTLLTMLFASHIILDLFVKQNSRHIFIGTYRKVAK